MHHTLTQLKTYAAQTGLVYQYYFVGQRAALPDDPEAPSTEYVFDVTSDRKTIFAVSIFLPQQALGSLGDQFADATSPSPNNTLG